MLESNFKTFLTKSNKEIFIFDNLFNFDTKLKFFEFMSKSRFVFDGGSSYDTPFRSIIFDKPYIQSLYTLEDLKNLNFLSSKFFEPVQKHLANLNVLRSYVYTSDHTTTHFYHTDPGLKTLLYYPMLDWKNEYGGETMFANDYLTEIEFTSMYVPGRIILFDASIPHKMSAPSSSCPYYRFSFVINWN